MASRLELQEKLEELLGSRNVYFQPPESIKLSYPCIIYDLSNERVTYADNKAYHKKRIYTLMIIDKNPDSILLDKLHDTFMYCMFVRSYTADNLHHYVYELAY